MIWFLEGIVLLVFVWAGGFEGFIAWAVLTALVLFSRHSYMHAKLKEADLNLKAEKGQRLETALATSKALGDDVELPAHLWVSPPSRLDWMPRTRLDFRTMMMGTTEKPDAQLVRRVSSTQWETKLSEAFRKAEVSRLNARLSRPTVGSNDDDSDRRVAQGTLESYEKEPTWEPLPEEWIAALETGYQRYLVRAGG